MFAKTCRVQNLKKKQKLEEFTKSCVPVASSPGVFRSALRDCLNTCPTFTSFDGYPTWSSSTRGLKFIPTH